MEKRGDLSGIGETMKIVFGKDQLLVQSDFKSSTRTFDQGRKDLKTILDLSSQTGRSGEVISLYAVFDRDFHRNLLQKR